MCKALAIIVRFVAAVVGCLLSSAAAFVAPTTSVERVAHLQLKGVQPLRAASDDKEEPATWAIIFDCDGVILEVRAYRHPGMTAHTYNAVMCRRYPTAWVSLAQIRFTPPFERTPFHPTGISNDA